MDFEDKVQSQEDYGDWYASTWTGDLLFVIHKYLRVSVNSHVSFNGVGQETSSWIITDYDIVNQFMLSPNVYQVKVYMDYLHSWLNIFNPLQNLSDEKSILYKNLTFQAIRFSLLIQGQGNIAEDTHTVTKTANTCLVLKFDEPQKRERIYKLLKVLRNMFHILINKKIGISKIVLNADKSWDAKSQSLRKKDERENWILNQSFLPDNMDDKVSRPSLLFKDIKNDFGKIIQGFLDDVKLQSLVSTYLTIEHFDIPLDTSIVTLLSGVETYYNNLKYSDGKRVKSAKKKLTMFIKLEPHAQNIINHISSNIDVSVESLITKLQDSRDYFVHGVKEEKFTSETDLVPYLFKFERLYQRILCDLITLKVEKNNE